jgi:hypothetical protein
MSMPLLGVKRTSVFEELTGFSYSGIGEWMPFHRRIFSKFGAD